jgi:SNF2 family DNA or RNA helicase
MRLRVAPGGLCRVVGEELLGRTIPPFAVSSGGMWTLWWHDLPSVLRGVLPEVDEESAKNYRRAVFGYKKRVAAIHDDDLRSELSGFSADKTPRPYQARAAQAIHGARRLLLADSVGMGKTLSTWAARELILRDDPRARTVIVCPSGLKYQWLTEAEAYSSDMARLLVVSGTSRQRARVYGNFVKRPASVLIMNYELLRYDCSALRPVFDATRYVIADEASRIKTRTTKTAKLLKKLTSGVRWRVAVTATPIEVGCENLHSIVEWLDPRLLGTRKMFDEMYVRKIMIRTRAGRRFPKVVGYKNLSHLKRRVRCVMLRRRPSDVGEDMPEVSSQDVLLDFDEKHRVLYEKAREGCREKLRSSPAGPMVATLDAKKACLSPIMVKGGRGQGEKTRAIVEMLTTEAADEQALVFVESLAKRYLTDELVPAIVKAGVKLGLVTGDTSNSERASLRTAFNSKLIRVLAMDSVGTYGLNLPCGLVLNADLPWNPAKLEQRIGRARRMAAGVKHVRVVNFVMRDSVEQRVLRRLLGRKTLADTLVGDSGISLLETMSSTDWEEML